MSRHRNIRRGNYDDEYDDVYGGSYGASHDDREMCVSPSTMAQFTFSRRLSEEEKQEGRRRHLDSITEQDQRDYDVDMDGLNIDEESYEVAISDFALSEYPTKLTSMSEALDRELTRLDLRQSLQHVLHPLMNQPTINLIKRMKGRDLRYKGSKVLRTFSYMKRREKKDWFMPVKTFMTNYIQRQSYWFDFSTEPIRFPLNSNAKGKLPTPINEVDTDALVSKTGVRVELGTKCKNEIPVKFTEDALNAMDTSASTSKKAKMHSHLSAVRDASPSNIKNGSKIGSAPSSPSLRRSDPPLKILKPEVVEAEYQQLRKDAKPTINLVVIGHVDAGKSTLMGRLLCDLGYVSQKTMHRNETDSKKAGKSSFAYAWVLDETDEERSRGITMDVASSRFETTNRRVTILDAPGHKDFIPNMITGAAQADVAVLVVDSTVGEFESGFEAGGQTREHTMLVRSLGVSQLAVVVNKLDNVKWDRQRYSEIKEKLSLFLKQTGFKETDVTFVPCSGLIGENLGKRSSLELLSWYSGPCLVEVIDKFRPPERPVAKPCRITIADIFKGQVSGVCISARVEAGFVTTGQKMIILPSAEPCSVKSISLEDEPTEKAFAGDNIIMILLGCDSNNMNIGSVICEASSPVPVSSKFEAKIVVFNSVQIPITKGFPVVIHSGSSSEQAIIKKLVSQINRSTGEVLKMHPRCLFKNSSGIVVIEVSRPICLEKYKDNKDLGRFMLRSSGNTIAAGLIDRIL